MPTRTLASLILTALLPAQAQSQCEIREANDNQAFDLGVIRMAEPLEFTYSSFNEPNLVFVDEGDPEDAVFQAIKRAMGTVESAVKQDGEAGEGKRHNLFSLKRTDLPFHPSQTTGEGSLLHYAYVDDNYAGVLYSGDGINTIGWVDFAGDPLPLIWQHVGAITYTVWNEAREIIERDILLQANQFQHWAVMADLTKTVNTPNDCSDTLDVQGVMTHMLAHAVGLRPVTPDDDPNNGDERSSTLWDDPFLPGLTGRIVLSNAGNPTHHWQTLTPGDARGIALAAPDKDAHFTPGLAPVAPEPGQIVLHYDFEDLGAATVRDQSGNALHGALVGSAAQVPGPSGMAMDLSSGQYVDLDGASFPREKMPADAYTLAAWMKLAPGSVSAVFTTVSSTGMPGMELAIFPGAFLVSGMASTGSNLLAPIASDPVLPSPVPEDWFHYAISWDRNAGVASLYLNGELAGEITLDEASLDTNWKDGAFLGRWIDGSGMTFAGAMDELVLANYAMSAAEITGLVTGQLP